MLNISAVIICKDEEKNIEECIKSVIWCDEVVIIDSFSSDKTVSRAENYTDKIFRNEWKGFAEQRKFALTKVKTEWILSIDADERCSNDLKVEIENLQKQNNISSKGFLIPRKSYFLGKWVKNCGWYPDYQLRLFRKDSASVKERLVHEGYIVSGNTDKLKSPILHFTVNSISEFTNKINHYSTLSAIEKNGNKNISFIYLLSKPVFEFIKKFIFQKGFLDGINGLMVSLFHMMTKALTYMKLYELQNKNK